MAAPKSRRMTIIPDDVAQANSGALQLALAEAVDVEGLENEMAGLELDPAAKQSTGIDDHHSEMKETLHEACKENNKKLVMKILKEERTQFADMPKGELAPGLINFVNMPDRKGRRPLDYAAVLDAVPIGKLLLDNAANPNTPDSSGRTPLLWASYHNRLKMAKLLLDTGADIRRLDGKGRGVMHLCSRSKDTSCFTYFLKKLPKPAAGKPETYWVDLPDKLGLTPLHWAAFNGSFDHIRALIKAGADPFSFDAEGKAVLHWLASSTKASATSALKFLVDLNLKKAPERQRRYYPTNLPDSNGRTVFQYALGLGTDLAETVLKDPKTDCLATDNGGRAALHWAIRFGQDRLIPLILERIGPEGSEARNAALIQTDKSGWTPLHYAAHTGSGMKALVKEETVKRNIDQRDIHDQTPLMLAVAGSWHDCVVSLVACGAAVNEVNSLGCYPIHIAAFSGHANVVQMLLEKGAQVDVLDSGKQTPLLVASERGHTAVSLMLLEAGADAQRADKQKRTALHNAAASCNEELCVALLDQFGADVNAKTRSSRTPLHVAVVTRKAAAVTLVPHLLRRGADVNARDASKQTSLHTAICIPPTREG